MKRGILFAVLFAAYFIFVLSSCCTPMPRNGCPGATSQGRVPGKFKGG